MTSNVDEVSERTRSGRAAAGDGRRRGALRCRLGI